MEIKLTNATIRSYRIGDEHSIAHHANNENISQYMRDQFSYHYSLEAAQKWIPQVINEKPELKFAIAVNDIAVGGISLETQTDIFRYNAELGYWLGEEYWGRGIISEAIVTFTKWGFENFDFLRIFAGVLDTNVASKRVLEKAGFQFEARIRKGAVKNGIVMDDWFYSLIRQ